MEPLGVAPEVILARMGLIAAGQPVVIEPLTGGVSSSIQLVRGGDRAVVLKRALRQLRVSEHWEAPPERSTAEVRWLRFAATIAPEAVPKVLAFDDDVFAIALEYLPPEQYPNWKQGLLAGSIDASFAAAVGSLLARLHGASAGDSKLAVDFDNSAMFEDLRIEPYLRRSAAVVPESAAAIAEIIGLLVAPGEAVIHGDLSPKNILCGRSSPVILDAECATWSEPAFDAAFCLSHLWLKAEYMPAHAAALRSAGRALRVAYLNGVTWEDSRAIDQRISQIIPGLLLARVVGASPAEYLDESARASVRDHVTAVLRDGLPLRHPLTV